MRCSLGSLARPSFPDSCAPPAAQRGPPFRPWAPLRELWCPCALDAAGQGAAGVPAGRGGERRPRLPLATLQPRKRTARGARPGALLPHKQPRDPPGIDGTLDLVVPGCCPTKLTLRLRRGGFRLQRGLRLAGPRHTVHAGKRHATPHLRAFVVATTSASPSCVCLGRASNGAGSQTSPNAPRVRRASSAPSTQLTARCATGERRARSPTAHHWWRCSPSARPHGRGRGCPAEHGCRGLAQNARSAHAIRKTGELRTTAAGVIHEPVGYHGITSPRTGVGPPAARLLTVPAPPDAAPEAVLDGPAPDAVSASLPTDPCASSLGASRDCLPCSAASSLCSANLVSESSRTDGPATASDKAATAAAT